MTGTVISGHRLLNQPEESQMNNNMTWWEWVCLPFMLIYLGIKIVFGLACMLIAPLLILAAIIFVVKHLWLAF